MQDFYQQQLYFGILHATVILELFCALLLWIKRNEGERARHFLVWSWLACAAIFMIRVVLQYSAHSDYATAEILPVASLLGGLTCVTVLLIYPIEVVSPHWLNAKRFLLVFSPTLLMVGTCGVMHGCGVEFRKLSTFEELARYWTEANVWIRFLLCAVIIVYSFLIFYIPRNKMRSNTTIRWMRSYSIGLQGISILYFGINLFGLYPSGVFHITYFLFFTAYITYQELFLRLFITPQERLVAIISPLQEEKQGNEPIEQSELEEALVELVPQIDSKIAELLPEQTSLLWTQLESYMKNQEPWRDPNLTLAILADGVDSNRTTISTLIQKAGYEDFYTYVARYRIEAFCSAAREGRVSNIQDAFFEVGFRNRNTALNQFKKQMCITPSDYLRNKGH